MWIILAIVSIVTAQASAGIFEVEPSDQVVPLDSKAQITFQCKAKLENTPIYSWRKNDQPLPENSRFKVIGGTLQISQPQASDGGDYQCVVKSDEGVVVSNYGKLIFAYIDEFASITHVKVTTSQGSGVKIECQPPQYEPKRSVAFYWESKNSLTFVTPKTSSMTKFVSQKDGSLYLANPVEGDTDSLVCHMRSTWEVNGDFVTKSGSPVPFEVVSTVTEEAPKLLAVPAEVTKAKRGGSVYIECFASGNPTPTVNWTRVDGKMPTGHQVSKAGQLVFTDVTEASEGRYRCTATNSLGEVSAEGRLELQYAPQWVREITTTMVDKSETATLRCEAAAVPPASYLWMKNGVSLTQGSNGKTQISNDVEGSTLYIYSVDQGDTGMYQCEAVNDQGTIFSSARIVVRSAPPVFVTKMNDITKAAINHDVIIPCNVTAAPAPTFTWTKDQMSIENNPKYSFGNDGSLTVKNVDISDEGQYACNATNILGSVDGQTYLQAYQPTIITKYPLENIDLTFGDAVDLECSESHDVNLVVTWKWTQNGKLVIRDEHYANQGGSLKLMDVEGEQTGTYACCASTEVGSDCASVNVSVLAPPSAPNDVTITPPYSAPSTSQQVTWQAAEDNGAPVTKYEVHCKNGFSDDWVVACSTNVTSCLVEGLLPYNDYQYTVYAWNKIGRGEGSEPSTPQKTSPGAPVASPSGVSGGGGKPGQLVVTWERFDEMYYGAESVDFVIAVRKLIPVTLPIDLNGNATESPDLAWRERIEYGAETVTTTFTHIDESEIYAPYEAKVRAVNSKGDGPFSSSSLVHTAELAPSVAPSGFNQTLKKAYNVEIKWNPIPSLNGKTLGYYVSICDDLEPNSCDDPFMWRNLTTEEASINIYELNHNGHYRLKAAAFNRAGAGPYSDFSFVFFTAKPPPDMAPNVISVEIVDNTLTVKWKPVEKGPMETKITGYVVQYWKSNETSSDASDHPTSKTEAEFDLPGKNDYNIWVRAYNEGGNGRPSTTYAVSTQTGTSSKYGGKATHLSLNVSLLFLICFTILKAWLN